MMFDIKEIKIRREKLLRNFPDNINIIISKPENIYYFSNFSGDTGMLIYIQGRWTLLSDGRFSTQAKKEVIDTNYFEVSSLKNYYAYLKKMINPKNMTYIEEDYLSIDTFKKIKMKFFKEFMYCDITPFINEVRKVKSEYEIQMIKKAEDIGSNAFLHILDFIKEGVRESDICAELEYFMKKNGASKTSFDTIVASGENGSMPHAVVTDRIIKNGDFITMDFGCKYNNYCSDMTRTVAVGTIDNKKIQVYNIVLNALNEAKSQVKDKVIGRDIDKIARDYISSYGYEKFFNHSLGHSIGLEIHESPNFSPSCKEEIKENMILSVEPGIYIPNEFGVRIEDLILVKNNGYIDLTSAPKKLYYC